MNFSEQEKLQVMYEWMQSHLSILQFAKKVGISQNRLYFWRDKYVTTGLVYKKLFNKNTVTAD